MNDLFLVLGLAIGVGIFYFGYLVGRNTSYQDKNIVPPPAPVRLPTIANLHKPIEKKNPAIVDDRDDERTLAELMAKGSPEEINRFLSMED